MLRKLLAAVGLSFAASGAVAGTHYSPYSNEAINAIYNLLFCDNADGFKSKPGETPTRWQSILFSSPSDFASLEALASDPSAEGRVRFLAYSRLREQGKIVQPKILLGVIIEVPLSGGLDTLAAFSEGGVRYINQSGKLVVIEGAEGFLPVVKKLFSVSEPVVSQIGPWAKPRLAPPKQGNVRLTFLVSDGLYFGEGPMSIMQSEAMAGPIINNAAELLQAVVATGSK